MEQVELSYMAGENAILYRTGPLDNSLVFSYKDKNILKNIYFTFWLSYLLCRCLFITEKWKLTCSQKPVY